MSRSLILVLVGALLSTSAMAATAPQARNPGLFAALRLIDGTIRGGEKDRANRMMAELQAEQPNGSLTDFERLEVAKRLLKLGRLGDVGRTLAQLAGPKDGALRPIGDEDQVENIEARIAATVMVGRVDEGAELLRQCHQPAAGKEACGTFRAAAHINAFNRGPMARRLLEIFAPTRGIPPASYYQERADAELKSPRGGPIVALSWARTGLRHHPKSAELHSAAAYIAWVALRHADAFDHLTALARLRRGNPNTFVEFTKRSGIAPHLGVAEPTVTKSSEEPADPASQQIPGAVWIGLAIALVVGGALLKRRRGAA